MRSDRGLSFPAFAVGTANKITDIQIGVYTFGTGRTVTWNTSIFCRRGANSSNRDKSGSVTTTARTWKWITVRDGSRVQDFCNTTAIVEPDRGGKIRLKVRVR